MISFEESCELSKEQKAHHDKDFTGWGKRGVIETLLKFSTGKKTYTIRFETDVNGWPGDVYCQNITEFEIQTYSLKEKYWSKKELKTLSDIERYY